jgi:hypothetical protein
MYGLSHLIEYLSFIAISDFLIFWSTFITIFGLQSQQCIEKRKM